MAGCKARGLQPPGFLLVLAPQQAEVDGGGGLGLLFPP